MRTRTVTLEFASPDSLYTQLVAPDDRTAAVRAGFDALLEASNDRPGATVISARYLLVTGVVKARRDTLPARQLTSRRSATVAPRAGGSRSSHSISAGRGPSAAQV